MIRHKKPGRHTLACARTHMQHTHVHKPLLPLFPSVGRRVIPSLSPPFSQVNRVPPFPPFQTPTLMIREAAGTKEPAQTLTKQETQKQSKDTPGNLTAPSHTTTTGEGAGWGRVFDSHKDDTRKKKKKKTMKKGQQSTSLLSAQTERRGGCRGQSRQSDDCFLPILSASKSLAGLGLPPDSGFSPPGPSSACQQCTRPL